MGDNQKQENITLESLYAYLHESEALSKREWAQMREEAKKRAEEAEKRAEEAEKRAEKSEKEWKKIREESEKEWKRIREEAEKRSEELDRRAAERAREIEEIWRMVHENNRTIGSAGDSYEEIKRIMAENASTISEINRTIGSIGNNNGEFAEEYFQSAFQKNPGLNGETYNRVIPNMRFEEFDDEYDIFLSSNKSIAIIEVKYSVRINDIGKLLQKADNFRKFLPRYNNRKLYLGIASLSFRKVTESKIMEQGIAVIKQVGDKMVVYDENLKVF